MRRWLLQIEITALSLLMVGCHLGSEVGSTRGETNSRVYLAELKSSNDLTEFEDLSEEFTFECSTKDSHRQKGKSVCAILCHVPPGNPLKAHTILVGVAAVQAHLTHGPNERSLDYLGPCEDDSGSGDGDNDEDGDDDGDSPNDPDRDSNEEEPSTDDGRTDNEESPNDDDIPSNPDA